jgi:surfeit locus 1 family protein
MTGTRTIPFWATILTIAGVIVLCGLGTWQLQRLAWKNELTAALDVEYAKNADLIALQAPKKTDEFLFRRGTMYGVYDFDKEVLVGPRVYEDLPGKHAITPLKLQDGSWILVNRGWVPQHWSSSDEEKKPTGQVAVTGLLRMPDDNPFAPENVPAKDQWYSISVSDIAAAKKLKPLQAYVLYEERATNLTSYPIAAATKPELNNNHLQYALFWFTLAATLIVIYSLRFLKKN